MIAVGDKVVYIPDECHLLTMDASGNYPFIFGVKKVQRQGNTMVETVVELDSKELEEKLAAIRRSSNSAEERKKLIAIRPNPVGLYQAVVTAIHSDGSADLDILSSKGGVTLHYTKIKQDQTKKSMNSFFVKKTTKLDPTPAPAPFSH